MCGRFVRNDQDSLFGEYLPRDTLQAWKQKPFAPRYNISPGTVVEAFHHDGKSPNLEFFTWGLLPSWSKDQLGQRYSNARIETIAEKPSFKGPYLRRRCLIQAEGYYEWQTIGKDKIPFYIHKPDGKSLALGGIWDIWAGKDGSEEFTLSLITRNANKSVSNIHDRMPLVIPENLYLDWLDPSLNLREIQRCADSQKDILLKSYEVSRLVNSTQADSPSLINPFENEKQGSLFS
ncbi:SOS response-associated peptidase [Leptospira sp. GIMC2001]|uniref:SOS response-associated peptidase n=1 Tax=Leptospira sp. GIMC2001 TaxID=1513297 RepID=UPI002349F996|nr:SOS response-associated peptidase [Leptospira sp. GIMC2001]WCL48410.1 SOS response-associated peptidase [Leptospira sp. GIMC2001]